jgi:xanthine/uracil permease
MDRSQRHGALVYAITFPLTTALMTVAFTRFLAPILVWNQDSETARNLSAHAHTYRLFIAASCLNGLAGVVLLTALYVVLRPVNRGLALFAALSRLLYVAMWFVQVLGSFSALHIMGGEGPLQTFESKQLQALAGLQLASGWDAYYIGLTFYALSTLVFSWLFFQSRYVPKALAAYGMLASTVEGMCAFVYLNDRGFGAVVSVNWYEMPTALFELGLCIWILVNWRTSGVKRECR